MKVVEYTVGGGLWKVVSEAGVDTHDKVFDLVEIGFTGFSGQHVYFQDGSTDSDVQVGRQQAGWHVRQQRQKVALDPP